ncbi:MAG: hypothetical protein EXS13_15220 [Planctomycetes bacterium]|nr:hypothetical protein [Planctomycetota bacterium]
MRHRRCARYSRHLRIGRSIHFPQVANLRSRHCNAHRSKFLHGSPPESDDELAFVMAHEIAHVQRDHYALERYAIKAQDGFDWVKHVLNPDDSVLLPEEREEARVAARDARLQKFSQAQEFDADRVGAYRALAAGVKPGAIATSFARMHDEEKAWRSKLTPEQESALKATRDHPEPDARFKALQRIYGSSVGEWKAAH